jgi:hypothetical protein
MRKLPIEIVTVISIIAYVFSELRQTINNGRQLLTLLIDVFVDEVFTRLGVPLRLLQKTKTGFRLFTGTETVSMELAEADEFMTDMNGVTRWAVC